jgi:ribulose 1,5-bisphosphate synthetase/thiazole synthase
MNDYETDVVVVGGGPAGLGAAIAAARTGAKTMLVESGGCLGGTWTLGLQNHVTSFHDHRKIIIRGIALEIMKRLAAAGGGEDPEVKFKDEFKTWWTCFEPETLKWLLDEIVTQAGVKTLLHTFCVGVERNGSSIRNVVVESKSGRQTLAAKLVIDCTGDADVAHFAGAATVKGRSDGRMQPVTTAFLMMNVDYDRMLREVYEKSTRGRIDECERQARERGELDVPCRISLGAPTTVPGVTYHNTTRILGIDATCAADLTRAEMEGRRQVRQIVQFYRQHVPGYENARLMMTSPSIGLRETRRIVGRYELTRHDVLQARKFADGIACNAYYIDLHNPVGTGTETGSDVNAHPPEGSWHHIPYRCLLPGALDNLLVAGRCISADRDALGAVRVTACCVAMGQAAGTAAALAAQAHIAPAALDAASLRLQLRHDGVWLD